VWAVREQFRDAAGKVRAGAGTAYTALRSERAREALGWKRIPTLIVGGAAVLLGLLSLFAGSPD
jgi:hypothetical protein